MKRVSDEVWAQLDHRAGRLSSISRWRVAVAGSLGAVLAVAAAAGWYSGLVSPQLSVSKRTTHVAGNGDVVINLTVTNDGWLPADVQWPGSDRGPTSPGLTLLRTEGPLPARIVPRASVQLAYVYRIESCATTRHTTWRPSLDVARPWGAQRVSLIFGPSETLWVYLTWPRCPTPSDPPQ